MLAGNKVGNWICKSSKFMVSGNDLSRLLSWVSWEDGWKGLNSRSCSNPLVGYPGSTILPEGEKKGDIERQLVR